MARNETRSSVKLPYKRSGQNSAVITLRGVGSWHGVRGDRAESSATVLIVANALVMVILSPTA
jgi:hypothetical protein